MLNAYLKGTVEHIIMIIKRVYYHFHKQLKHFVIQLKIKVGLFKGYTKQHLEEEI